MEPTRELDQIRLELQTLHDRSNNTKVALASLEATTEQRFEHIVKCLESMGKSIENLNTTIQHLEAVATEGRTALRTLLWVGGFIGSIAALFLTFYDYIPK